MLTFRKTSLALILFLVFFIPVYSGCSSKTAPDHVDSAEEGMQTEESETQPAPDVEETAESGYNWNLGSTIRVPDDYEHLSAALRVAQNGDTILLLAPGVYDENVEIKDLSVRIMGADPTDPAKVEATQIGRPGLNAAIIVGGTDPVHVLFSGVSLMVELQVQTAPEESSLVLDRIRGKRVRIRNFLGSVHIEQSQLENHFLVIAYGQPITIRDNRFSPGADMTDGGVFGVDIRLSDGASKGEILVENNIVEGWENAFQVRSSYADAQRSGNVLVRNNEISGSSTLYARSAVSLLRARGVTLENNTISNARFGIDIDDCGSVDDGGAAGYSVDELIIKGNTISNNGTGIRLKASGAVVIENIISNNQRGIRLENTVAMILSNQLLANVLGSRVTPDRGAGIMVDKNSNMLDPDGNPILPPKKGEAEPYNTYQDNEPDDIYFAP